MRPTFRRVICLAWLATAAGAQDSPIRLIKYAGGFDQPLHIASSASDPGVIYVVEQAGRVHRLPKVSSSAGVFLDISGRISCCGERGLLSVALPGTTGSVFAYYTDRQGDITVSRFAYNAETGIADPASEFVVLKIPHREFGNHNGGQLAFGPDGSLYIGTGDGGGGGDPLGNGQNLNSLLGKVLRIFPTGPPAGSAPYVVPPDNPFIGRSDARPEIWAYGLRNPWRFSFDRVSRELYIADVGQNLYEEINVQPAASKGGENYGWNRMEGMHCFQPGCSTAGLTLPVHEYGRAAGDCSVTGGFVSRAATSSIRGMYLYGDFCTGRIWGLTRNGAAWQNRLLLDTDLNISSFGEGRFGEIFVADHSRGDVYIVYDRAPAIPAGGVVDAAGFQPLLVPGSLGSAFGTGIMPAGGVVQADWPAELNGVRVMVNGRPVPVAAVANNGTTEQVNFQVPWDAAPGRARVSVVVHGVESAAAEVDIAPAAPELFEYAPGRPVALRTSYQAIRWTFPCGFRVCMQYASPGETLLLWGTGFGPVENQPATGVKSPFAPLARTVTEPLVTVAGVPARVLYSGLAPGYVGLYQLNVELPQDLASGSAEVVVSIGGRSSKPLAIEISR